MLAECACNACKVHKLSCTHDAKTQMQIQNAHTKAIQHMGPSLGHGQFLVLNCCSSALLILFFVFFIYLHIFYDRNESRCLNLQELYNVSIQKKKIFLLSNMPFVVVGSSRRNFYEKPNCSIINNTVWRTKLRMASLSNDAIISMAR